MRAPLGSGIRFNSSHMSVIPDYGMTEVQVSYPRARKRWVAHKKLICLDCFRKQLDETPNPSKMLSNRYMKKEDNDIAAIPTITADS